MAGISGIYGVSLLPRTILRLPPIAAVIALNLGPNRVCWQWAAIPVSCIVAAKHRSADNRGVGGIGVSGEMSSYARLAAAMLALGMTGFGNQPQPGLLSCTGDFGQFANGFIVTRLMELNFAVDWTTPSVTPLNGGSPARIISMTSLEVSFEVQYEGYRAAYHLNRVDGTFSQRPNLGGIFFGRCELKPLETKF
jgi:hypothetical protein